MDLQGFEGFLTYGIGLCGIFSILAPIIGWRKRGRQTLLLGFAFLAMAGVLWGLRENWATAAVGVMAFVLVVLLALDALTRKPAGPN